MARITHMTAGQAGIQAENSADLAQAIAALAQAGYVVVDVEDDPTEPWHVATVPYTGGPQTLKTLKTLVA